MPLDSRIISAAAESLSTLAKAFDRNGETEKADALYRQAAELELSSPELQNCWGGPLNGQVGRQAVFLDLLHRIDPVAVIETGTFRGITAEWLAQNFSGPIITCEKERIYFLQAQARLSRYPNVGLRLEDSRSFLLNVLSSYKGGSRIFIYLDAHWEHDLPLREELQIIFSCQPSAVVAIDDFRVPDDIGYGWDDYGPGKSIDIDCLKGIVPNGTLIFFPRLRSGEETGAVRGSCIIATESVQRLETSPLLRAGDLEHWSTIQKGAEAQARQNGQIGSFVEVADPHASYPQIIGSLEHNLRGAQAEGEARLEQIYTLTAKLEESRAEGEARLEQINTLTAMLEKSQAEGEGLADLWARAAGYDRLIATLRMPEGPRSLKIVLPLARLIRKARTLWGG